MAKYLKSDSEKGYIEDYVDIQALKFDNVRHTALGNMLGDYDNEGNYVIDTKIVNELISMPKYVVEVMENLEICLSVIKFDKQLSFLVAFEGEKATLSLLEKVSFEANNKLDAGTWSNVNEYILDVVETVGEVDRQALYMKWNIQAFPGNMIDIFNCEDGVLAKYFNIINRIKYNMEVKSTLLEKEEELEEVEAEYALDMFTILQSYPELLKLIQTQLKKEITEKKDFLKLDKPNFTKTFNELLNKAIENNVGSLSEFERANFESDKRNVKIKSNIKKYDVIDVQEEKLELEEDVKEIANNKIVKIPAEVYKYQTFEGMATGLAKVEKEAENKSTQKATDILLGKGKGKKFELFDYLSKMGIKQETIASNSVIETVRARTLKDLDAKTTKIETKETNSKTSSVKASSDKGNDKKKDDKKKDKKKDDKKKEEKNKKGEKEKEKKKEEKTASSGGGGGYVGGVTTSKTEKTEATKIKTRTLDDVTKQKNNQAGMLSRMTGNNLKEDLKVGQDFLKREESKQVVAGANSDATLNVTSTSVRVSVRQHKVTIQRNDETLNSL